MGLDLATRGGVLRFAELRRAELREYYLKHGQLEKSPFFYVFATHKFVLVKDPINPVRMGAKLPKAVAMPCPVPLGIRENVQPAELTKFMGNAIKMAAKATKALGVLVLMDAWMAPSDEAPADHHYGWIEERPDKREGLYMSLEHMALTRPHRWTCIIERDPVRLSPWLESSGGEREDGYASRLEGFVDWRS